MLLSIVSPVYKSEGTITELLRQITSSVSVITDDYEIILVEDNGGDRSWEIIKDQAQKNKKIKALRFSRNFGQHYAITAGLEVATGDYVVVLDCDLQDNPSYIAQMMAKVNEGYDIVYTRKETRKHSLFKNITAKVFFYVFNYLSDNQTADARIGNYTLLSRKTVNEFLKIKDKRRHYLMVLRWLGFKAGYIDIVHEKRFSGKTSYTIGKLINHAIDGITSQSDKMLRLSVKVGFMFFIVSLLTSVFVAIRYFLYGAFYGWTSLIIVSLLSTGLILMSSGVLGIYIGKIFEQVKDRPLYIVDEKINL